MRLRYLIFLCALSIAVSGCAFVRGAIRESKANAALYPYVTKLTYSIPKSELLKIAVRDLQDEHDWHMSSDRLYQTGSQMSSAPPAFKVNQKSCDLFEGESCASAERTQTATPTVLEGISFDYYLFDLSGPDAGSRLEVRNKADGTRLTYKELQVYRRYNPEGAQKILLQGRKTYPDLQYEPWD